VKCDRCGAPTHVEYTKDQPHLFRVQRTRLCFNGHRLKTFELHSKAASGLSPGRLKKYTDAALKRVALYQRDLKLLLARRAGASLKTLADSFSMLWTASGEIVEASEMLALVDKAVENFKEGLLAVGSLKRLNKAQREALARAYSPIVNLPAVLRDLPAGRNRGSLPP
jgi:hypothetical protein